MTHSTLLRVALAQINTIVGDFRYNIKRLTECIDQAEEQQVDILVFPELSLCGYPPEDLLFRKEFVTQNLQALTQLTQKTAQTAVLIGFVDRNQDGKLFNAAAVLQNRKRLGVYHKIELPNYGVFDEKRYFQPGRRGMLLKVGPFRAGLTICEDIWIKNNFSHTRPYKGGSSVIINMSASPYHAGKLIERLELIKQLSKDLKSAVLYCNSVGGQDELVFDGSSFAIASNHSWLGGAPAFHEHLLVLDVPCQAFNKKFVSSSSCHAVTVKPRKCLIHPKSIRPAPLTASLPVPRNLWHLTGPREIYEALVLGTRDYVEKNGFSKTLIGISGGIDSALVAAIAVDALGKNRVAGVTMPSPYTSKATLRDSMTLAKQLDIQLIQLPIHGVFSSYLSTLREVFSGTKQGVAEENLQARIRGALLMALSNKFGYLVLTTGNKSELATGYCTLYGDMAGGFAVIKDVPKTTVYELARYRNQAKEGRGVIPETILRRAPTAELRPNQKDQDSLPPYALLDCILHQFIEQDKAGREIKRSGASLKTINEVISKVDGNEYKRRQAPPGIKITPKSFGRDRRVPITHRFNR